MEKVFRVDGMTCSHCIETIKKALRTIDGIDDISINFNSGEVRITAKREIPCDEIKRVIEEWDYKVVDC